MSDIALVSDKVPARKAGGGLGNENVTADHLQTLGLNNFNNSAMRWMKTTVSILKVVNQVILSTPLQEKTTEERSTL